MSETAVHDPKPMRARAIEAAVTAYQTHAEATHDYPRLARTPSMAAAFSAIIAELRNPSPAVIEAMEAADKDWDVHAPGEVHWSAALDAIEKGA